MSVTGKKRAHKFSNAQSQASIIDKVFFVLAGLVGIWLAVFLIMELWSKGWWIILLVVVAWLAVSYLTLPRLHSILTDIYVPGYFIGRARTSDGLLGDPINIAGYGSLAQLHATMRQAGWTLADPITASSAWKIVTSTLRRHSYPQAPVSPLFLFDRKQDFAYQQEVDGNPKKRHHVRFWKTPPDWPLPGGHKVDWVASGTFDRAVGLSLFTLQVTHRIDENIDIERDHVVKTVVDNVPGTKVHVIEDFSTGYHSRNGGGDLIKTDGDLRILDLRGVDTESQDNARAAETLKNIKAATAVKVLDAKDFKQNLKFFHARELEDADHRMKELAKNRPFSAFLGILAVQASAVISVVTLVVALQNWQTYVSSDFAENLLSRLGAPDMDALRMPFALGGGATMVVLLLLQLVACWRMMSGSQAARIFLLSVTFLLVLFFTFGYFQGQRQDFWLMAIHLALLTTAMVHISDAETRQYVARLKLESEQIK
ncbi:MAG: LssY C-terminal domain-containing protein [Actinomycetaceae bacterium]|nr:LssY C-terminal domain-containing protein [Actinomycetaceae bacterium]